MWDLDPATIELDSRKNKQRSMSRLGRERERERRHQKVKNDEKEYKPIHMNVMTCKVKCDQRLKHDCPFRID